MKNFLSLALAAIAVFGFNAVATAQDAGPKNGAKGGKGGPGGQGGPGGMMARRAQMEKEIFAKLNLTKDQQSKVTAAQKKRDADMKKMFESSNGDFSGMREKSRPIMESYNKDLEKILDKNQQAKLKAERKAMREKMQKQGGGRGPGGPGAGGPGGGAPRGGGN
jgi:Spy/CpxP family protein refolding chaperone